MYEILFHVVFRMTVFATIFLATVIFGRLFSWDDFLYEAVFWNDILKHVFSVTQCFSSGFFFSVSFFW